MQSIIFIDSIKKALNKLLEVVVLSYSQETIYGGFLVTKTISVFQYETSQI